MSSVVDMQMIVIDIVLATIDEYHRTAYSRMSDKEKVKLIMHAWNVPTRRGGNDDVWFLLFKDDLPIQRLCAHSTNHNNTHTGRSRRMYVVNTATGMVMLRCQGGKCRRRTGGVRVLRHGRNISK